MAIKTTLGDLRNGIQEIYRDVMREQAGGEASNAAILQRVRTEKAQELALLTPELVNISLIKLLNDVSSRRRGIATTSGEFDLFGEYRIPRIVSIARGKKKDTAKLTLHEAQLYVKAHSDRSVGDRYESLRRLIEDCREHVESEEDTLGILIERKRKADRLAIE